uniref:Uncharacterized protein n=1 Tax=Anguilla anguilla TaxID=7936 RepID=A0A0E9QL92_ANGAN
MTGGRCPSLTPVTCHTFTLLKANSLKNLPYLNPRQNDDGRNAGALKICPLSVRVMNPSKSAINNDAHRQ